MSAAQWPVPLEVESGHNIECWRCSREDFYPGVSPADARDEFHAWGWRMDPQHDGPYQMCPECMGSTS